MDYPREMIDKYVTQLATSTRGGAWGSGNVMPLSPVPSFYEIIHDFDIYLRILCPQQLQAKIGLDLIIFTSLLRDLLLFCAALKFSKIKVATRLQTAALA